MRQLERYERPASAAEAVAVKEQYGKGAAYLAGGSDLLVHPPEELRVAIDIRHAGLSDVEQLDGSLRIGGAALLRDIETAVTQVAGGMLTSAIRETAPWLIRNAATLAGNIANASPSADGVAGLAVLDAQLVLLGSAGEETVALLDVLAGPRQTCLGNRLIQSIEVPVRPGVRGHFIKLSRSKSDIAQVNVAVALEMRDGRAHGVRIALGSVAPTTMRARGAEALLEGQVPDDDVLRRLQEAVSDEVRPITDWRASESYRRRMAGVLTVRALKATIGTEGTE